MWKRIHYLIREFSYFSPTLKKGTWILIVLIIMLQIVIEAFKYYSLTHYSALEKKIIINSDKLLKENIKVNQTKSTYLPPNLKVDPNNASIEELKSLGFSDKIAQRIVKYRNKGGKFYHLDDLKKIYGIDTNKVNQLKDYLKFSLINVQSDITQSRIELNTADSTLLESLPAIGHVLSKRIIKYRDLLGGFYALEQLNEVYGLSPEIYKKVIPYLSVDTSKIKRIPIQDATLRELAKHPYIRKEMAVKILQYRKKYKISSLQQMVTDSIISSTEAKRLEGYIAF